MGWAVYDGVLRTRSWAAWGVGWRPRLITIVSTVLGWHLWVDCGVTIFRIVKATLEQFLSDLVDKKHGTWWYTITDYTKNSLISILSDILLNFIFRILIDSENNSVYWVIVTYVQNFTMYGSIFFFSENWSVTYKICDFISKNYLHNSCATG